MSGTSPLLQEWAVALSELPGASDAHVHSLLAGLNLDHVPPTSTRETLVQLLPLAAVLERSNGQVYAQSILAWRLLFHVSGLIQQLPVAWVQPDAAPAQLLAGFRHLTSSLHRVCTNSALPFTARQELSSAIARVLIKLLQSQTSSAAVAINRPGGTTVYANGPLPNGHSSSINGGVAHASAADTPQVLLLRVLVAGGPNLFPMLPTDACSVLAYASEHLLHPPAATSTAGGRGTRHGTGNGVGVLPQLGEKALLLLAHCASAVSSGLAGDDGQRITAAFPATAVLSQAAGWAVETLHSALAALLGGAGSHLLGAPIRAAAQLATASATALLGIQSLLQPSQPATAAAATATVRSAANPIKQQAAASQAATQAQDVIDVSLDVTEACVAAAAAIGESDAPQGDRVLDIAARMLEDSVGLISALASLDQPIAATFSRLKALLLATAVLVDSSENSINFGNGIAVSNSGAANGIGSGGTAARRPAGVVLNLTGAGASLLHVPSASGTVTPLGSATMQNGRSQQHSLAALGAAAKGTGSAWEWDVTQPLIGMFGHGKAAAGRGAERLCMALTEGLCQGLAASWSVHHETYVRSLLLVPEDGTALHSEQQALALAQGRLFVLMRCDDALARALVPLLMDPLTSGHSNTLHPHLAATLVRTLAAMAAASSVHGPQGEWTFSQIVDLLCRMYRNPDSPVSASLMSAGYKLATGRTTALASAITLLAEGIMDAPAPRRHDLRLRLLMLFCDLCMKAGPAVATVSSSTSRIGSAGSITGRSPLRVDMGALLPALALSCRGLEDGAWGQLGGGGSSLQGRHGSNRFSFEDIRKAQKQEVGLVKLFRAFWVYIALFRIGLPGSNLRWALGEIAAATPMLVVGSGAGTEQDTQERLKAELGDRLSGAGAAAETTHLGSRLNKLLTDASSNLAAATVAPVAATPSLPPDAPRRAYLLAVATCELARASAGPLPKPGSTCPIVVPLAYLQITSIDSPDAAWYTLIAQQAFLAYLQRINDERVIAAAAAANGPAGPHLLPAAVRQSSLAHNSASQPQAYTTATSKAGFDAPGRTASSSPHATINSSTHLIHSTGHQMNGLTAPALGTGMDAGDESSSEDGFSDSGGSGIYEAAIEDLGVALVSHLAASLHHEEGCAPQVVAVADSLLKLLLARHPSLYWSHECVQALLGMLEAEEGERPLGHTALPLSAPDGRSSGHVWKWLDVWIHAAALAAPARTEALLHQFLGRISVAALHVPSSSTAIEAPLGSTLSATPAVGLTTLTRQPAAASSAALRRAAELLGICSKARRQAGGAGTPSANDGTLALCRKQYYAGAVAALQTEPDAGLSSIATRVHAALTASLGQHWPMAVVEQRFLTGAALLASAPLASSSGLLHVSGSATLRDGSCYALLQALCVAPLSRFSPPMMQLALFAWTWVSTASPRWLLPLVARVAGAWRRSVDLRLGLFSGHAALAASSHAAAAAASSLGGSGTSFTEAELLAGIACHRLWLTFFNEVWDTLGHRSDSEHAAIAQALEQMLHHSLQQCDNLSSHPASVSARFRLLQFALSFAQQRLRSLPRGSPVPPSIVLLHDRVIKAGLQWFEHPASWTAKQTQHQADEQHMALTDFIQLLESVPYWPTLTVLATPQSGAAQQPSPQAVFIRGNRTSDSGSARSPSTNGLPPGVQARVSAGGNVGASSVASTSSPNGAAVGVALSSRMPPTLPAEVHPVWGAPPAASVVASTTARLLALLARSEAERLRVWAHPRSAAAAGAAAAAAAPLPLQAEHVVTAWRASVRLAVELVARFPGSAPARVQLEQLVAQNALASKVQMLAEAAVHLATPEAAASNAPQLAALATWAPARGVVGLELISGPCGRHPAVKAYAIRCLHSTPPEEVAFFLSQLVQSLRHDDDGSIAAFLVSTAARSDLFAHALMWALATEERPPQEEWNPEVKRSGWQPPKDYGLWTVVGDVMARVLEVLPHESRQYWDAESTYFDQVTGISGTLKKFDKDLRKGQIAVELAKFAPTRSDLYVPTNPTCRVINHIGNSGTPMQSAAKVPILVAFNVEEARGDLPPLHRALACIFKVGDDCRQDVLALQVISLLKGAFVKAGLELYLCPYGCIPTGYERGIIEVVPNTKSRAALGELSDRGLYEIFQAEFGAPGSPTFEAARRNFIISEAGYAIASYLLQAKDRHNGNLLIDNAGHLVHIDFGFILEISPGGNMGFESAAFKLSHEMTQLLDPGHTKKSAQFQLFEELCIRGYLAARTVAEPILAAVALMSESGLPCFSRGQPLVNLRKRFNLHMSEAQAAAFMHSAIQDAYQKWTTGFYDYIQSLQNRIPY